MSDYQRDVAKEHIAEMHRDAERRRRALLAGCCARVMRFYSRLKDRVAGRPVR